MSEDNKEQEIAEVPQERVYPKDWGNDLNQALSHFKKQGMPSLARVRPEDIFRMKEMYMNGSSYREIAMTFNQKIALVIFLSEKERWYCEKIERAEMIAETLSQNYGYIKSDSTLFLTELLGFWQNYYREQIKEYKRSKDPAIVQSMDLKPLEKYFKALDLLDKAVGVSNSKDATPLVNINMGDSSITQKDGSITLTPTSADKLDSAKVFELLAELKRQQDLDIDKK